MKAPDPDAIFPKFSVSMKRDESTLKLLEILTMTNLLGSDVTWMDTSVLTNNERVDRIILFIRNRPYRQFLKLGSVHLLSE